MRTLTRFIGVLILLAVLGGAAGYFYAQDFLVQPAELTEPVLIEIPRGLRAREVVRLLHQHKVVRSETITLGYLAMTGARTKLRAGEYYFEKSITLPAVVDKLVKGNVYLRKFTVPEGLTVAKTALKWEEQGFGTSQEFLSAAGASVSLIRDFDQRAKTLEGYLFPETYSFPKGTTAHQAVEAMVGRFRAVLARLSDNVAPELWPLDVRDTVILASLIETEAAHGDERPIISSVYVNRLKRNILLQCDPTVIYALELANQYRGRLTLADLRFDSPYNTYRYPGLPPGAIANPGYAALEAAISPATSSYLFFVRTEGGRHTFSETLAAHNRAVAQYRLLQRQSRASR